MRTSIKSSLPGHPISFGLTLKKRRDTNAVLWRCVLVGIDHQLFTMTAGLN